MNIDTEYSNREFGIISEVNYSQLEKLNSNL